MLGLAGAVLYLTLRRNRKSPATDIQERVIDNGFIYPDFDTTEEFKQASGSVGLDAFLIRQGKL